MAFSSIVATEALFSKLGLAPHLKHLSGGKSIKSVLYDPQSMAVLVTRGFDHSTYPDQHFLLLINGVPLNVWRKFDELQKKSSVVVHLNSEVEHLEDSFFISLLTPVLCIPREDEDPVINVLIMGRKNPASSY